MEISVGDIIKYERPFPGFESRRFKVIKRCGDMIELENLENNKLYINVIYGFVKVNNEKFINIKLF